MGNVDNEAVAKAIEVLRAGGVILYPTDTIWGIGCDATNPKAVARVYEIKKRADSKALVLLASDLDMICRYVREIPDMAIQLVEVNDSPMTIIYPEAIAGKAPEEGEEAVPDRHFLAWNVVAEDGSVAIRIPDMDFCKVLIHKLGRPIVSTSANISGEPSPKKFADIPEPIRSAVDHIVDPAEEKNSTGKASQIIKVGIDGQICIIRS
ncbi:MAG: L-threonylcarbamoyladenylate synthase [Candidatus Cryptobacteroides sp.]|nr:L-threonylcarbamoyladenylate synthase [Candidatus Cryptobacteroides sp.]